MEYKDEFELTAEEALRLEEELRELLLNEDPLEGVYSIYGDITEVYYG